MKIWGLLPPVSSDTRLRLERPAEIISRLPVAVEPVKLILSTPS